MKVYYRRINPGEKYCCSLQKAKEKFRDTFIKLNFGSFNRTYVPFKNEIGYNYFKKI